MNELAGSVVVITGASRGIGAATARAFAAIGCHVVLAARSTAQISTLTQELQEQWGIKALAVTTDVRDTDQVEALMAAAQDQLGGIDVLINNAGLGSRSSLAATSEEEMIQLFDVNVFGPVRAMRAAIPYLRQRGGGTIVNIGSIVSHLALPADGKAAVSSTYCATKFALRAYTVAARAELLDARVHTILAVVGLTKTDFQTAAFKAQDSPETATTPRGGILAGMKGLAVSPDKVAERLVKAVQRQENEVCISWFDRLLVQKVRLVPCLEDFLGRMYLALGSGHSAWQYLRGRDFAVMAGILILLRLCTRRLWRR